MAIYFACCDLYTCTGILCGVGKMFGKNGGGLQKNV